MPRSPGLLCTWFFLFRRLKNGELGHLFVLAKYQRQGIAKELPRLRIEYTKAHGLDAGADANAHPSTSSM
ncbi:GNAT family N-acetyltransferase [Vibrio vulnificus]|uniref:GNAT family N-acetyltransferase n=1 Tax=Vibrio vulnificus TaxID=672 RepID=UPI003EDA0D47